MTRHGIYIYDLGRQFTKGVPHTYRNRACRSGMYSLDVRLHQWLLTNRSLQAASPETARAYFIPFYQSCLGMLAACIKGHGGCDERLVRLRGGV